MTVPYRTRDLLQRELDDARREVFRLHVVIIVFGLVLIVGGQLAQRQLDRHAEALALCESGGL